MDYVKKEEFEALERRVSKLESPDLPIKKGNRRQSPKEFLLSKNPATAAEAAICLIYFNEGVNESPEEGIGPSDLVALFRSAREKTPANASDVLGKCAKKGWIDNIGKKASKGRWVATNTGIDFVENLGGENGRTNQKGSKTGGRNSKGK